MREAEAAGFLVALNHPRWSNLTPADADAFEGLWAVEVYNRDSELAAKPGENDSFYDALLRGGRNPGLRCLATDDAHTSRHVGHGWVNIRAERLDYGSIAAALRDGHFYSSTGPELLEASLTDGRLVVRTSPCVSVSIVGEEDELALIPGGASRNRPCTEWTFPTIACTLGRYIRTVAKDECGGVAWTNAMDA